MGRAIESSATHERWIDARQDLLPPEDDKDLMATGQTLIADDIPP